MKVDAKEFHEFIKKCSLNGRIDTCIIRGDDNGLTIKVRSGNAVAVAGQLTTIKENITLPIKSTSTLLRILSTFTDKVMMEKKENVLKIYDEEREAEIVLAGEEFIENDLKEDLKFTYEGDMTVKGEMFRRALTNRDIVRGETMLLEVKDNIFSISTQREKSDKMVEKCKVDYKDCRNEMGQVAVDVFQILGEEVRVAMKTDYPVKIVDATEDMKVVYHIAPLEQKNDNSD